MAEEGALNSTIFLSSEKATGKGHVDAVTSTITEPSLLYIYGTI